MRTNRSLLHAGSVSGLLVGLLLLPTLVFAEASPTEPAEIEAPAASQNLDENDERDEKTTPTPTFRFRIPADALDLDASGWQDIEIAGQRWRALELNAAPIVLPTPHSYCLASDDLCARARNLAQQTCLRPDDCPVLQEFQEIFGEPGVRPAPTPTALPVVEDSAADRPAEER